MKLFVGAKGIVRYANKVLILRESSSGYTDGSGAGRWDVPGGRIESHETVREGLIREIKEESGLDVLPKELLGVFDGFPMIQGEKCHIVRLYFLCEASSETVILSQDHDAYEWVNPNTYGDIELMDDLEEMLHVSSRQV